MLFFMQDSLVEHFLGKKQVEKVDLSLISNVNSDNVVNTFNTVFNSDWTYEILNIDQTDQIREIYLIIAVYVPGRVLSSMASFKVFSNERNDMTTLLNEALVKALKDLVYNELPQTPTMGLENIVSRDIPSNVDEEVSEPVSASDIDKLENDIKNETPKNEYGLRKDQIDFMNDFKVKHTIDTDEKFNHYVQTWCDNTIYEINTKKELILAGEKVVDEFIQWISIASANDTMNSSIVSPI